MKNQRNMWKSLLFCCLWGLCVSGHSQNTSQPIPVVPDSIYVMGFNSGNQIKASVLSQSANRMRIVYLKDTVTILRSNLKFVAEYRQLGVMELIKVIYPQDHPDYGQEIAVDQLQSEAAEERDPNLPEFYILELKGGSKLIGKVVRETSELVVFSTNQNELTIRSKDIRNLRPQKKN